MQLLALSPVTPDYQNHNYKKMKEKLKRKVYYLLPSEIKKVEKNAKIRQMTGSQFIRLLVNQ